jgi:hypothetical protein
MQRSELDDEPSRRQRIGSTAPRRPRRLAPEELAWVALGPCAALTLTALVVLGPLLGHLLFSRGSEALWPAGWWEAHGHAEPAKHGRFLVAVLAPALLAGLVLASRRWRPVLRHRPRQSLILASQLLVLAVVGAGLLEQHVILEFAQPLPPIFGVRTLVAAAVLTVVAIAAPRRRGLALRLEGLAHETTGRRAAGLAIALCFIAIWLLKVPLVDGAAEETNDFNLTWTLNDAFAVLNGRTPLVDYHAIYAKLLPYPAALALAVFGTTALVYTTLMALLDGLALLAVYAVFRRLTRSSLLALTLFLPFVATSDIDRVVTSAGAVSPMTLAAMWPMRYGGAYLVAWLTARRLDKPEPRRRWPLFLVGGLLAIDNLEFGLAAMLATIVALLCARPPRSRLDALRFAGSVAGGALGAVAAVCLLTLLRAGALPSPAVLLEWPRIFTELGWFSLPLAPVGLHLAIYATFAGAIVVAAVRLARRDGDALLTGMLAWSGVFGLAAAGYFVARPDVFKLTGMLSAWSFALVPLTIVSVRALSARGWRRPALPELLVLFGFALSATALARLSPPQRQITRLSSQPAPVYRPATERFVRAHARPGETVVILVPMSYRIAYDLGLRNVAPYGLENAIVTRAQMQTLIEAARRDHVRKIFTPIPQSLLATEGDAAVAQLKLLLRAGYKVGPYTRRLGLIEFQKAGQRGVRAGPPRR